MIVRAAIVTPWIAGDGVNPNRPKLLEDYPLAVVSGRSERLTDITGQPSANIPVFPNEYTLVAELEEAKLAAIQADAEYEVIWTEII